MADYRKREERRAWIIEAMEERRRNPPPPPRRDICRVCGGHYDWCVTPDVPSEGYLFFCADHFSKDLPMPSTEEAERLWESCHR